MDINNKPSTSKADHTLRDFDARKISEYVRKDPRLETKYNQLYRKMPNTTITTKIATTSKPIKTAECTATLTTAELPGPSKMPDVTETPEVSKTPQSTETAPRTIRKSSRLTRSRSNRINPFAMQNQANRGRGRRHIFKSHKPVKTPTSVATVETSDSLFYRGSYLGIGDIMSITDVEGDIYYAQIRGFMTDGHCEKSAVITWLLPTQASPPPNTGFDPATYYLGPEEDIPRKLECMKFVMRAPTDYYKSNTPYPPAQSTECIANAHRGGFIWKTINPLKYQDKPKE